LPIGGVLYAVFAGWIISRDVQIEELGVGDGVFYRFWLLLTRYVAPVAIATVLVANL